jgi:hypothetical protein
MGHASELPQFAGMPTAVRFSLGEVVMLSQRPEFQIGNRGSRNFLCMERLLGISKVEFFLRGRIVSGNPTPRFLYSTSDREILRPAIRRTFATEACGLRGEVN